MFNCSTRYIIFFAAHSLFGAAPPGGFGNHLAHLPSAYAMMGRSPHQSSSSSAAAAAAAAAAAYGLPPTSAAGGYGGLGTLSVAASQAASLGINPASK